MKAIYITNLIQSLVLSGTDLTNRFNIRQKWSTIESGKTSSLRRIYMHCLASTSTSGT